MAMGPVTETRTVITMSTSPLFCYGFSSGSVVKNPPAMQEPQERGVWSGRSPGGGRGNLLQYSCQENPTEEPGRLQSIGSQRVGHDLSGLAHVHIVTKIDI